MKDKPRFTIDLIYHMWDCGDGCCSDSGFKVEVLDNEVKSPYGGPSIVYDNIDWDYNRCWKSLLETSLEKIEKILNRTPVENVDYTLTKFNDDERGNFYDSDWGFF